ncbi:MAG TPA: YkgJ family cysteine cluster protein [Methanocella sp.]|uniref:YkgJ family cysteine cluster protein n=1 Tax=Methanocella sp. TaxID=2052833 RepID=UPI002C07ED5E|nr:YkgJ family cysteine cluster protein [Methanocella sp.]HTY90784.1 YkgJ family cysteine cluster protein [Methanocella sp.]
MSTGNFFERCKRCKACCRTSDRFVHIHVCGHEKRLMELLAYQGRDTKEILVPYGASCPFLNGSGCTLADIKPLQCRMYPLLFLRGGSLGVDPACTSSEEYMAQLEDASSEAWQHYDAMRKEAAMLSDKEKALLAEWSHYVPDVVVIKTDGE